MAQLTGGEIVYETLVAHGVDTVFGIVSVHNIPIYDAIQRGGAIRTIDVRHEQGALHAADGYSRRTGKLGVAITSTGPGATNAMTGLLEAGFASSRVLMITGQTESWFYGKGKGVLHEAENQLTMLKTVTRRSESPRTTGEISGAISRLINDINTGRPQPGAIEIPVDLQYAEAECEIQPAQPEESQNIQPGTELVAEATALIAGSSRRIILAGGGVIRGGAIEQLTQLAEALNAPVYTSLNGKGSISEDHELSMGANLLRNQEAIKDADLVIAVGTRFQGQATAGFTLELPGRLIHIDADPNMLDLNYKSDIGICGDARVTIKKILEGLNAQKGDADFLDGLRQAKVSVEKDIRDLMGKDFQKILDVMAEHLPRGGNLVKDATVAAYVWANSLLPTYVAGSSMHSTSFAIGPGLPLGIGAALGSGEKTVIIQGDGGFMLNIAELATAVQYQLPIVICLFNDKGYDILRRIQALRFEGRTTGVDLATPDFVKLAEAMGLKGVKVSGTDEFASAFKESMKHDGPVLLDIDMSCLIPMKLPF